MASATRATGRNYYLFSYPSRRRHFSFAFCRWGNPIFHIAAIADSLNTQTNSIEKCSFMLVCERAGTHDVLMGRPLFHPLKNTVVSLDSCPIKFTIHVRVHAYMYRDMWWEGKLRTLEFDFLVSNSPSIVPLIMNKCRYSTTTKKKKTLKFGQLHDFCF